MSFGVRFKTAFRDIHNHLWTSYILDESFSGNVTELTPTDDPLMVEYLTDSDDLFDPIKPTKADINVIATSNFSLADLYENDDMHYKAKIFQGDSLITEWANNNYETFVSLVSVISSAIDTADGGDASCNGFLLTAGQKVHIFTRLILTSGQAPTLKLIKDSDSSTADSIAMVNGCNVVTLTAAAADSYYLTLENSSDTNFQTTGWGVFKDSQLYLDGWVDCGNYEEPYDDFPYPVTIKVTDGLSFLKDIIYKDENDDYYNGRQLESQIVIDILNKIGFTGFAEYINIYETTMTATSEYSPFDQLAIDQDVFKDMYCYSVLEEICKKYGAILRQWNGVFTFQRPIELTQSSVYGRVFTAATTKSTVTLVPLQQIKRLPTHATNRLQVKGGVQMIQRPAKVVRYIQDFGDKESWIDNYQFTADTFSGGVPATSAGTEYWTRVNGCVIWSMAGLGTSDSDGVIMGSSFSGNLTTAKYLKQIFGFTVVDTDNVIEVGFSYKIFNTSGATINGVGPIVVFKDLAGNNYLNEVGGTSGNYAEWTATPTSITANSSNIPDGGTDWVVYGRTIVTGLPVTGPYEVRLYGVTNTIGLSIAFKDIVFRSTSVKIAIKRTRKWEALFRSIGNVIAKRKWIPIETTTYKYIDVIKRVQQVYEKTNPISGSILEYPVILGDVTNDEGEACDTDIDNIYEQFAGSLAVSVLQTTTQAAASFVSTKAGSFLPNVALTNSSDILIFTSNLPGTDFIGTTSITTLIGDLTGAVTTDTPNTAGTLQITESDFAGSTSGSCEFDIDGMMRVMYFGSGLTDTLDSFISNDGVFFTNYTLTRVTTKIVVTENAAFGGFTLTTTNLSGDLNGTEDTDPAGSAGVARIDHIDLSGTNGSATIVCNGSSAVVSILAGDLTISTVWNTRDPGLEDAPVIDIVSDEVRHQYSRARQFVQMAVQEDKKYGIAPSINVLGTIQDSLNLYGGSEVRTFAINAGEFEVKRRSWSMDLIEILEHELVAFDNVVDHNGDQVIIDNYNVVTLQ